MRLRRPPAPSPPPSHQAPRSLPLPSPQALSKKRRVSPSPRTEATPTPVPPPHPALATSAPAAAFLNPYSLPRGDMPAEPAYVDPPTAPPPAADEKPSTPSPPAADEEPSTPPAAARPVLAWEARKMKRKVIMIRNPVPKDTFASGKAAAAAAVAGEGCAPDEPSSHRNAALDEAVGEKQNAKGIEVEKLPSGCNSVDVDETLLGEEAVGGVTLICKPVLNTDSDACEAEQLASTSIGKEGFGISERAERQRRITEVFVCGLDGDTKEEDVRLVFVRAGEITEVRMVTDARTSKSKGYCFVRYREPSRLRRPLRSSAN